MRILLAILFLGQFAFGGVDTLRISAADIADAYLKSSEATNNYGAGTTHHYAGIAYGTIHHAPIWFDLSSIPSDAVITVALCSLWCWNVVETPNIEINRITSDWVEGTAIGVYEYGSSSWNNQGHGTGVGGTTIAEADSAWASAGGDYTSPDDTILVVVNGWNVWACESIVQYQVTNGENLGMLLKIDDEGSDGRAAFRTTEHAVVEGRPRAYIEYFVPPQDLEREPSPWGICGWGLVRGWGAERW